MNISSLIDTSTILDEAFKHPVMRIKPRSKKRPDIDAALKAVINQVEYAVAAEIAAQVEAKVQEAYEGHLLLHGEHADAADGDEWELEVDEMVEREIEEWTPFLSADWLGRNTIGTGLHLPDGVKEFAIRLGREYYEGLVSLKTPAQILSSAGITKADVEARLEKHINPTEQEIETMTAQQTEELQAVSEKIAAHIGKDFDTMTVYDDIDLASDDDDGLAFGAAARLGLEEEDVRTLQGERLMHGTDIMDIVLKQIEGINESSGKRKKPAAKKAAEQEIDAPRPPKPKAEKPAKAPKKVVEDEEAESEGNISVAVLQALKECGAKDDTMAKGIGTSRATYNNYANAKAPFEPTPEQLQFVRDEIVERLNKLHEALATIDGTEAEVVF